jgi:poly(3-hydroxyalkanoate) synthetase
VNAERNIHKFADFAAMYQDSDQARMFVAVEDWLNEGFDLPPAVARTCVVDWYGQNKPAKGEWIVGGSAVDPSLTTNPVLVVTSSTDRLVPEESSHALANMIPHSKLLQSTCGHIGMMTSRRAQNEVWKPIADWIAAKQ